MTYILIFEQIQATEIQMSACKILKQALKNRGKFLSRCVFVELFAFMNIQVVHENTNLVALFLRKYKLIYKMSTKNTILTYYLKYSK